MNLLTPLFLLLFLFVIAKGWRYFLEHSDDFGLLRSLEPWFWFVFLNLSLFPITIQYDHSFAMAGLLVQLSISAWFAFSMGWIVKACHHKTGFYQQSWFVKGKSLKFCYRCGARIPKETHAHLIKDTSWQNFFFQVPPHLFQYIVFWMAQSIIALVLLFVALKVLEDPVVRHRVILSIVTLALLVPPLAYSLRRFRGYLSETKGLIWWADIKGALAGWVLVIFGLWCLLHFL